MGASENIKGQSYTTETVHYAVRKDGRLVQACGMGRRQLASLFEVQAEVNCRKCRG